MVFRYKDIRAFDNYIVLTMNIIYSMYRAGEVSIHQACCERATQPYSLGGGGVRFIQAQDKQVLPYIVRRARENRNFFGPGPKFRNWDRLKTAKSPKKSVPYWPNT